MKESRPAVYVLTRQGAELAARVLSVVPGKLFVAASVTLPASFRADAAPDVTANTPANGEGVSPERFDRLAGLVARTFHEHPAHIFIAACGIAVRTIAPLLVSKAVDPAVIVLDQNGEYVISLLGGHLSGANRLTETLAAGLGARPIITTASDCLGLPALDVLANDAGLKIADPARLREVMSAMISGSRVILVDPHSLLGLGHFHCPRAFDRRAELPEQPPDGSPPAPAIYVGVDTPPDRAGLARLVPPILHVGVGCKRGVSAAAILEAIETVFASNRLSLLGIQALCSIDAKEDEPGIAEAAKRLNARQAFFAPGELDKIPVTAPSPKALEQFGIPGVAEPCALASAGKDASLIAAKRTFPGITIAVARSRGNAG